MLNDTIEITVTVSTREGLLPKLMLELGALGILYSHEVRNFNYEDFAVLSFVCNGSVNCDADILIKSLESIPNVNSVLNVVAINSVTNKPTLYSAVNFRNITEFDPLRADDPLTEDVVHIAQQRLSDIYGPTLDIMVSRAVKNSKSVGELFLLLSKNLNGSQKASFLNGIEGLNSTSNLVKST